LASTPRASQLRTPSEEIVAKGPLGPQCLSSAPPRPLQCHRPRILLHSLWPGLLLSWGENTGSMIDADRNYYLCRLVGSGRDFGRRRAVAPREGWPTGSYFLPSCRAGEPRMRIRSAAHSVARSVGPVALGTLRSEDVGKPLAPPVLPITEAAGDRSPPMPLQCHPSTPKPTSNPLGRRYNAGKRPLGYATSLQGRS
jgi:hypothetical protein